VRTPHRMLLAALAAAMLLAAVAGTAGALSVNERAFRIAFASFEFTYGIEEVLRCAVTFEGTFNSTTIDTTRPNTIGSVTRVATGSCTGGALTVLTTTLPWALNYVSKIGIPSIYTISMSNLSWQTSIGGLTCLARGTAGEPANLDWSTVERTGQAIVAGDEDINLPMTGAGCTSLRLSYEGTAPATRAGSSEPLIFS